MISNDGTCDNNELKEYPAAEIGTVLMASLIASEVPQACLDRVLAYRSDTATFPTLWVSAGRCIHTLQNRFRKQVALRHQ